MRASIKKWTLRFLNVFITLALAVALHQSVSCTKGRQRLSQAQLSPMQLPIDFSQAGVYTATYSQSVLPPFGLVNLILDTPGRAEAVEKDALSALHFDIAVYDATGANVYSCGFRADSQVTGNQIWFTIEETSEGAHSVFVVDAMNYPKGDYTFEVTVVQAAPALATLPHSLRAEYLVSVFPMYVAMTTVAVIGSFGLAIFLLCVRYAVGKGPTNLAERCSKCGDNLTDNASGVCPECGN